MAEFHVIHSYNCETPNSLLPIKKAGGEGYQIYTATDSPLLVNKIENRNIYTINYGHSLINFFQYIIDNYEYLPSSIAFLKSNMLTRHIDYDYWNKVRNNSHYTLLWNDVNFQSDSGDAYHIEPGMFIERNNSWYVWSSHHSYFISFNQMLDFLFKNAKYPEWVFFAPGGCYIVEKEQILKYPKSFFQGIITILEYEFFPSEAWIIERMLHTIWSGIYEIQEYTKDYYEFLEKIFSLPDLSSVKNPNLQVSSKIKRFFTPKH